MKGRYTIVHLSDLHVCHNLTTLGNLFWDSVFLSGPPLTIRAVLQKLLANPERRLKVNRLLFRKESDPEKLSPLKLAAAALIAAPLAVYLLKQLLNFKRAFYISQDFPRRGELLLEELKSQTIDHFIVTGDLANAAHPREFAVARKFLDELGGPEKITVIPGNHDVSMHNTLLTGVETVRQKLVDFLAAFEDYIPTEFPAEVGMLKQHYFPFVRFIGEDIALIGLDSTTYHPVLNVRGFIDRQQAESLRALFQTREIQRRFKIVLLHHHVTTAPWTDARDGWLRRAYNRLESSFMDKLENAREVRDLMTNGRVDLILHGHQHHTYKTYLSNIKVFCAGSSIYEAADRDLRPFYEMYTYNRRHISIESRFWDGSEFITACPV